MAYRDPGTVRVTMVYQDTLPQGILYWGRDVPGQSWDCQSYYGVHGYSATGYQEGYVSQDSPGTVRVTIAYRDTLSQGILAILGEGDVSGWSRDYQSY